MASRFPRKISSPARRGGALGAPMPRCCCGCAKRNIMTTTELQAYTHVETPVGSLLLAGDDQGLRLINFQTGKHRVVPQKSWRLDDRRFADAIGQLEAYFAGELRSFHLRFAPEGTPFQLRVWNALLTIPYGETISYGELARRVGN